MDNQTKTVLPRMRYFNEAYEMIKQMDPDTNLSKAYVRSIVKSGKVIVKQIGPKRTLINVDSLIAAIQNDCQQPAALRYEVLPRDKKIRPQI